MILFDLLIVYKDFVLIELDIFLNKYFIDAISEQMIKLTIL